MGVILTGLCVEVWTLRLVVIQTYPAPVFFISRREMKKLDTKDDVEAGGGVGGG